MPDPNSTASKPSCLRQIEVKDQSGTAPRPEPGDDASRVGYGTHWFASVEYDDGCANAFPITYGSELKGIPQTDRGKVLPKPLLKEKKYEVMTTTGATGYGYGRFIIRSDGRVENLQT